METRDDKIEIIKHNDAQESKEVSFDLTLKRTFKECFTDYKGIGTEAVVAFP